MVNNVPTLSNLEGVFSSVLSILLGLAAITFFILLLSSGFKFITSGGDPKGVEGAKKTLTYAIGGLILIIASYLILLLIQEITKVNVTNFVIFQQP